MEKPTISVIVPVYNTASTLARCVDSVLAQSYCALEVVLVDDGSPDGAGVLCDDYAARHERVIVVHQANSGLAEARRAGLQAAHGAYVVHLDSDDTLPRDAVATLYRLLVDNDLDMAYGCYMRMEVERHHIVGHPSTGILTGEGFLWHLFDPHCICALWGSISRRELWQDDVFPPRERRLPSEDTFMLIRLTMHLQRVGLFNDVVYNYYYNPSSLSIAGPLHRQELWREYFGLIREHLQGRGLLAALEPSLRAMEINRLAFYLSRIDTSDPWYRQALSYPSSGFSAKTRVLQLLLRWPRLLHWLVTINRRVKGQSR